MKKKYITPSMMVIRIKTAPVLTIASTNTEGLRVNGNTEDYDITEGGSREGSIWDDEE
ncbi:hypothetical protein [Prevotella sp. E13-27]|uniref:hypothetical protein n=1 Tax=Prevotella sp. E13-27 TaxID=2938122 RepID=UPI002009E4C3|nr:hypothetical protein [Prevotella sp. E13-27]MCK8621560.1 hypothetical protein [Prevotella sp. E13-27]